MKLLDNIGTTRVVDLLRPQLASDTSLDLVSAEWSLFAFAQLREELGRVRGVRLVLPDIDAGYSLLGCAADRSARNQLTSRWLASRCASWLREAAELRLSKTFIPQGAAVVRGSTQHPQQAILGSFGFTTPGLGITPGNPMNLIQASETPEESAKFASWFDQVWGSLSDRESDENGLFRRLDELSSLHAPRTIYAQILQCLFGSRGEELDEERIVKTATGIRKTAIWQKLYKFQRDGVVGAIDKLNRFGGCIIADSVGLGKTFEALAIIKYHELRNDRVLVLCPKRLRDNWTLYCANDRRNVLAGDRFNYDVLNHTDLSRDGGMSGDIDLSYISWGNYDLVVIDESHNFRNKRTPKQGGETRYDRLMRKIVREGVKTRVLMLSATPVNNRLADLRNQIAFATEGEDTALEDVGIPSIATTTRLAQKQFNRWLDLDDFERTPAQLVRMLGFDYFSLLDTLTIARSRKHIEKYYGTEETGRFPERLRPINIKADVDSSGNFPAVLEINQEIRRLHLASYAPLRYILAHRKEAYDEKYSTRVRGGEGLFRQADREESLIHLMRVNVLKRMESSVVSFALTLERQLEDVEATIKRIDDHEESIEEVDLDEIDLDDPDLEALVVGSKIKVHLDDVDQVRWKQDLQEDRNRLHTLLSAAKRVIPERDAKLDALRRVIERKVDKPINAQNRKVIVFTSFADTANYLYQQLSGWAKEHLGLETALVTGTGRNRSTVPGLRKDLASILTAFAPHAKERPEEFEADGDIDLLIATDCISEGQNLQDCDWLINYDIHWNPVRIIQRFGRIDRLGSTNERIQLVNFWPNMELEEYLSLEQRVSGRMVLLDISATGEENLIQKRSGDLMNDLEYRRKQLLKLQDAVIDLEDLSTGVSIADLTLTDFRIDLAEYRKEHPDELDRLSLGACAVTSTRDLDVEPGAIFCLRAEGPAADRPPEAGYSLSPYYLVHVGDDGSTLLSYAQSKQILDRLKRLCVGKDLRDAEACARFDTETLQGRKMDRQQQQLAAAIASVVGRSEERAVESLFTPGGTHAMRGEFAGTEDFEVAAYLVVLSESEA